MKPRLLDLFSGAGGAAVGYHRAGFDVVGVDHEPSPATRSSSSGPDALEVPVLFDAGLLRRDPRLAALPGIHAHV